MRPSYLMRVGDAASQFINTSILNGDANESISGRAYRRSQLEGSTSLWSVANRVIDTLFFWDEEHCKEAYYYDLQRAHDVIEQHERSQSIQ